MEQREKTPCCGSCKGEKELGDGEDVDGCCCIHCWKCGSDVKQIDGKGLLYCPNTDCEEFTNNPTE